MADGAGRRRPAFEAEWYAMHNLPALAPVGGASAGAAPAAGGAAVRVLVVEAGEGPSARALERPAGGFEVRRAASLAGAERALAALAAPRADDGPEVVVLDVALPDCWPADACR